jgi:hypothetical protein
MTTFLGPDEATNVDLAESRHKRNQILERANAPLRVDPIALAAEGSPN